MPELTEEDLEKMSPEQIAELQKQNCIFCHIIEGRIPAKKVYEDDKCLAILDINPASKGHMLLVPKEHHVVLQMLEEETIRHLGRITKMLSKTAIRSLGAEGTNIYVASGAIAGQKAPHAMIHIIPRNEHDRIACFELPEKSIPDSDLKKMQQIFAKVLGTKIEPVAEKIIETKSEPQQTRQISIPNFSSQKKYITSEKAKRFHVEKCPFAEKITGKSRIYLTEEEARRTRDPCSCTGMISKKGRKKQLEKINIDELEEMFE
ncbi:HIT domain-containing protein [Candidatus Woesearchaeota archaeon]|nr:HIT domain-containing protein [Candidatus Woesearchaeota archaeon]